MKIREIAISPVSKPVSSRAFWNGITAARLRSWLTPQSKLQPRHLTPSQRAAVGVLVLEFYQKEAAERQKVTEGRPKKLSQKIDSVSDRQDGNFHFFKACHCVYYAADAQNKWGMWF